MSQRLSRCAKRRADAFYLGRRTLIDDPNFGPPRWQDKLYIALAGLFIDPSSYFKLPANWVVEIGEQVTI